MNSGIEMAGPKISTLEEQYVLDALRHGWYGDTKYHYVHQFEAAFAKRHQRRFALMTPCCTHAIHLALAAMGLDETAAVIAPECTWVGSTAGIQYIGATTVLVDIEPSSWCLCPEQVRQAITPQTRAIIAVNLYGNMANWQQLQDLAAKHNLWLIEDAAESIGSSYHQTPSGKFGDVSVFSFHRTKTMTTGEGGMLLTDNQELFERAKFLRDHGRSSSKMYYTQEVAFKYMTANLNAALGLAQLERLDELVAQKRAIFQQYQEQLGTIKGLSMNPQPKGHCNSYWAPTLVWQPECFALQSEQAIDYLAEQHIPARPFFYPLSSLPAYQNPAVKVITHHAPNAQKISQHGINLPAALNITTSQITTVCKGLKKMFAQYG